MITTLQRVSDKLAVRKMAHETYHGDLPEDRRREAQRRFLEGESRLILATPAFGLGVDKKDIRRIVHFEVPGSLEAYYQEIGRAGRDGAPAHCTLLYRQDDLEIQMRFIEWAVPEPSYLRALYDRLISWRDRLPGLDIEDLRAQLSFKNKKDHRLETSLALLDRWGVVRWPQRKLSELEILGPLEGSWLSQELWSKRKVALQKKLLALVELARSPECRKLRIYRYFGWPNETPCGFCDRCEERR